MSLLTDHLRNSVVHGDCVDVMRRIEPASVDFILTDPPYLCRYRSCDGQTIANDDREGWLMPAFAEMYRVFKSGELLRLECRRQVHRRVARGGIPHGRPYRLHQTLCFLIAIRAKRARAGLPACEGEPAQPLKPIDDVRDWHYTGNRLHPTQKSINTLQPLIEAFCPCESCARPVLRVWIDACSRNSCRTFVDRHQA